MNIIPSSFNEHQINRTTIGGMENHSEEALNISVIILSSEETHFKSQTFENLINCNFQQIICVEKDTQNYAIYDINKKFPQVKFILPQEESTDGELINIAMAELQSDYVLVLRDSLYIPNGVILSHLAERLTKDEIYCVVPRLFNQNKVSLPCTFSPSVDKSKFAISSSIVATDGTKTLYPFDFVALYNRKKFIKLGGFDYTIKSPYWQNMDMAMRSWLWGEETKITTLLQLTFVDEVESQDTTVNLDYLRFYLKNQLPKIKMETGYIKKSSFISFYLHSGCGILEAKRQFNEARDWVKQNKYMFKMDIQNLVKNW